MAAAVATRDFGLALVLLLAFGLAAGLALGLALDLLFGEDDCLSMPVEEKKSSHAVESSCAATTGLVSGVFSRE